MLQLVSHMLHRTSTAPLDLIPVCGSTSTPHTPAMFTYHNERKQHTRRSEFFLRKN
jgi:hypothetical protein